MSRQCQRVPFVALSPQDILRIYRVYVRMWGQQQLLFVWMCWSCQQLAAIIIIKSCSAFTLPLPVRATSPGTWAPHRVGGRGTSSSVSSLFLQFSCACTPKQCTHAHWPERSLCHARIVIKCWTLIGVRSRPTSPLPHHPLAAHRGGCLCVRRHSHECESGATPRPTAHRSVHGASDRLPLTVEPPLVALASEIK